MPSMLQQLAPFLSAVVRDPAGVGAVAPTSAALAGRLAEIVPGHGEPLVVELGAGTGAISTCVQRRLAGHGRHLAVERDPRLAEYLAREHLQMEVAVGDAVDLARVLTERGLEPVGTVDAVVSGLPWSLIPEADQQAILEAAARALRPGAAFTTIAYLPGLPTAGGRRFAALLDGVFDEVLMTRTVWANVPPAVTYVCRRPRTG